jgi:GTPase SAR1 family protein
VLSSFHGNNFGFTCNDNSFMVSGSDTLLTLQSLPEENHRELLYKILVVGDIGTGKTSIIKRYVHGIFSIHYKSTVCTNLLFFLNEQDWGRLCTQSNQMGRR